MLHCALKAQPNNKVRSLEPLTQENDVTGTKSQGPGPICHAQVFYTHAYQVTSTHPRIVTHEFARKKSGVAEDVDRPRVRYRIKGR